MDRNARTALLAAIGVASMTGLGFASVPLYRMFCQVTGLNGTTQVAAAAPSAVGSKIVTVAFDSNVSKGLPWRFAPEQRSERATLGERKMAFFTAKNLSDKPITGTAGFNVTPDQAGKYFSKIQCFCFSEQTLKPGEEVRMPVVYFVDPKLADDPDAASVEEITLSYTFYPVDSPKKPG